MSSERIEQFSLLAIALGLLLLGGALLVAVVNLGTQIASVWFLLIVQVAISILLLAVMFSLISKLASWSLAKFADLYERHEALVQEIKKRTPWFVVLTALVAQAVVAIADKSFRGDELPTVAVSLILILLFYLSNELILRDQLTLRVIGFGVWVLAVSALPFFVLLDRDFNWPLLYQQALCVPLHYKIFYTLIALVFVFTPLIFVPKKV